MTAPKDGEQLRECINSGQVSAAQVVAHAGAGELSISMFASREDFDKAVLRESADQLAIAGHDFWAACKTAAGGGAVRWLDFSDGTLIIFTRGEYRKALLAGVDEIPGIPVVRFQDDGDEDSGAVTAIEKVTTPEVDWKLAGMLIEAHELARSHGNSNGTSNWAATLALAVQSALAAERAEVARLREALKGVQMMANCGQFEKFIGEPWLKAVSAALTAPGEKHE